MSQKVDNSQLQDTVALNTRDNNFSTTQTIEGGVKTAAPLAGSRAEIKIGQVANSAQTLVVDPAKYVQAEINGTPVKLALVIEQGVTDYPHVLTFAATEAPACANGNPVTYYANTNTLTNTVVLHTNDTLTNPVAAGYYSNGLAWYQVDATGTIIDNGACVSTNTFTNTNGPGSFVYDENGTGQDRTLFFSGTLPGSSGNPNPMDTTSTQNGSREMDGTSGLDQLTITINASGGNITAFTNMTITDGSNDYLGVVSGNGTSTVTITFSIGSQKGRTFQWLNTANNETTIQPV